MGSGPYTETPEVKLVALMARDLNVTTTARELRMFIRANWRKISAYAHAIHCSEGQEQTPSTGEKGEGE